MGKKVEFYFDFSSPYTYIASKRIEKICEDNTAELEWKPFLLGGVFNEIGSTPAVQIDNKFNFLKKDVIQSSKFYGVELNFPELFPLNSVRSMRGAFAAQEKGKLVDYSHEMFRLYWTEGIDLSKAEILGEAVSNIGIDTEWFVNRIAEQDIKDKLRDETNTAIERGIFGAPTMFVDDQMFWGNDRLDFLDRYLKG
ncbi:MAG: 2-hydroxychromene-2-carboxylate isomerase [Thermodesulfobacteriota bacterium]|nr:MAG: 2-hydroxychromene-2-carboxylate isomerase [Thermodesulfobacteriota bacterium]